MEKKPLAQNLHKQPHHERQELCTTRPKYRQGRKLTSVKAYCVNDESRYLLLHGVPIVAGDEDVRTLCLTYGGIETLTAATDYPTESFCKVYIVKFVSIQSARYAKRKMDDKDFFGGILHVCYAPELETLEDTRNKLLTRQREILSRLNKSFVTTHCRKEGNSITKVTKQDAHIHESQTSSQQPASTSKISQHAIAREPTGATAPIKPPVVAMPRSTPAKRIVYHNVNHESKKPRKP